MLLAVTELQITTTLRFNLACIQIAEIKKTNDIKEFKCYGRLREIRMLNRCCGGCKLVDLICKSA